MSRAVRFLKQLGRNSKGLCYLLGPFVILYEFLRVIFIRFDDGGDVAEACCDCAECCAESSSSSSRRRSNNSCDCCCDCCCDSLCCCM